MNGNNRKPLTYVAAVLGFLLFGSPSAADVLNIRPIYQQTAVWCWDAVGEMVLKYFRVPNLNPVGNYQCGVVGTLGGMCQINCGNCVTTIGGTFQMADVLNRYQYLAVQYTHRNFPGFFAEPEGQLDEDEIVDEISSGRPIIAGVSPSGFGRYYPDGMSEHVTLIVGYNTNVRGR